jgi:hypothetical protein
MKLLLMLVLLSSCTMTYERRFGEDTKEDDRSYENGTFNK